MTRLIAKSLAPLLFVICFAASSSAQSASPEAVVDNFVRAWNAHDMKAWGRLFTDDAIWVTVAESRTAGRSDIVKDFGETHATWAKNTAVVQSDTEVRRVGADVAIILFRAGFLDKQRKLIPDSNRALLIVVVKQSDGWRITAGQLAHPSPQPK